MIDFLFFSCSCGSDFVFDFKKTLGSYISNLSSDKFFFTCRGCEAELVLSLEEVLKAIQDDFRSRAINIKKTELIRALGSRDVFKDPFEYCGKCDGFDTKGNCPKTIIKRCPIKNEL